MTIGTGGTGCLYYGTSTTATVSTNTLVGTPYWWQPANQVNWQIVQSLSNSPASKSSTIATTDFYDVPWYNVTGLGATYNGTHIVVSFSSAPSSPSDL
jgi:hypothetical protein